jgi:D-lactate dehydrogenase (cytochrome)
VADKVIIKTEKDEIQNYIVDASNLQGSCDKVLIPETRYELLETIRSLYNDGIPYTISGAGTGLVGGRVPFEGVLISLEKFNKIIEINPTEQYIKLEAGVVHSDMDLAISEFGLFFPPNPTEKNSFIGGNIACNSSGSRTFKYGTVRDYVLELTVILPWGEEITLTRDSNSVVDNEFVIKTPSGKKIQFPLTEIKYPRLKKNSAGYYIRNGMHTLDLFVGSEGTLGTIVESKLRLLRKPEKVFGAIIFSDVLDKAFDFVETIRKESYDSFANKENTSSTISARLIEYFDKNSLDLLRNDYSQIPSEAMCAVWIEQEYSESEESLLLQNWYDYIARYTELADSTWVATNDAEHEKFREFRHRLPLRVFEIVARSRFNKIGSDTAVPDESFRKYYTDFINDLNNSGIQYFIWGHIGNSHLHANLVPQNEEESELASRLYDKHVGIAIELGGTFSAEHGTGKLKRKYLEMLYGKETVAIMKGIKLLFDPKNLVGKDIMFF